MFIYGIFIHNMQNDSKIFFLEFTMKQAETKCKIFAVKKMFHAAGIKWRKHSEEDSFNRVRNIQTNESTSMLYFGIILLLHWSTLHLFLDKYTVYNYKSKLVMII